MKQFTDEQRIEFLKSAVEIIDNSKIYDSARRQICTTLGLVVFDDYYSFKRAFRLFPELKKHKPKIPDSIFSWFPKEDSASRIAILLSVIYEIENK